MNSPAVVRIRGPVTRHKARTMAFQVLFEVDGARHDPVTVLEGRLRDDPLTRSTEAFTRKLIAGVIEYKSTIDEIISRFAPSWPINQMAMVDRNILRIAVYEIMMSEEIPPKVAVNEAVELGKVFGSDSSPKLINGVLGSVMRSETTESFDNSRR